MRSPTIEESDLHALVDGELSPERRREVEDHLASHGEDAALVERWRRQNAALRAAFEPVAREAPPHSLRGVASRGAAVPPGQGPIETGAVHWGRPSTPRSVRRLDDVRKARRRKALMTSAATLLAGALAAGAAVLFIHSKVTAPVRGAGPAAGAPPLGYVARASVTYFTYVSDARAVEIDAARKEELAGWLRSRAGFGRTPDLSSLGLTFLGGRLAPGVAAPAGLLLYENANGARVGLYFERAAADSGAAPPRAAPGLVAIEWRASGLAFVLIGPLAPEAMQAAAEIAAAEVTATDPAPAAPK